MHSLKCTAVRGTEKNSSQDKKTTSQKQCALERIIDECVDGNNQVQVQPPAVGVNVVPEVSEHSNVRLTA